MLQLSTLRERYTSRGPGLLLATTAGITALHGVAVAMRFFLRDKNAQLLELSSIEWVAYILGPLLIEPVLLFGALYLLATRYDRLPSVPALLPGLVATVVVGSLFGQYVGEQLFRTGWTPLAQARLQVLFTPDLGILPYWRDLLEPLIRASLTAVAAVALATASSGEPATGEGAAEASAD